jgi:hypothetical protein
VVREIFGVLGVARNTLKRPAHFRPFDNIFCSFKSQARLC